MRIINPAIIGHPQNWFTILLMVIIGLFAVDQGAKLLHIHRKEK